MACEGKEFEVDLLICQRRKFGNVGHVIKTICMTMVDSFVTVANIIRKP
jgi:hypothetical protein